jgi:hypothetical protein
MSACPSCGAVCWVGNVHPSPCKVIGLEFNGNVFAERIMSLKNKNANPEGLAFFLNFGSPNWVRTSDLRINS